MHFSPSLLGRRLALSFRILLGLFFIISALAKWADIDRFEIYVFSYQWLSLNAAYLVARFVIVFEMLLGIGLVANICNRYVNICAVLLLTGFSLLIGYAALVGRTDSCQCMGALMDINPVQSLLKNALLFFLLLLAMQSKPWNWHPHWFVWLPVSLTPFLFVFITSSPDNWLFRPDTSVYDAKASSFVYNPSLASLQLNEGRHLVLFLTPECHFCQLTDQKMEAIRHRHQLDSTRIHYVVPAQPYSRLHTDNHSIWSFSMPYIILPDSTFRKITGGMRPLVMLIDNGKLKSVSHYRNISEQQIADFLR